MEITDRRTGLILTGVGAAMLLINQGMMLYFNSLPDFSVSGGGLVDGLGIIAFFTGLAIIYRSIKKE